MNSDIFGLVPRPFNVRITSEEEYPLMVDDDVRLTTDTVHLRLPVGAMGWQTRGVPPRSAPRSANDLGIRP